jgi:GalNAc-alpha-(1->4)-GalNAc-alpha-(1->3)-diNAcBac-PP-undecaprenol alpha-1,4-N-acetyl-D-galactosaminyltransferase
MVTSNEKIIKVVFVASALVGGGQERVISLLSSKLAEDVEYDVTILLFTKQPIMYEISNNVKIIQPKNRKFINNRILNLVPIILFIRFNIFKIKPNHIVSFGERYNSLVILSTLFSKSKIHVSNRASPLSSLKGLRAMVNPLFYKLANNVLVQTQMSINLLKEKYNTSNFKIFPNPFIIPSEINLNNRKNIILNVGSFSGKKNQEFLIRTFNEILPFIDGTWVLKFIGDGPKINNSKLLVKQLGLENRVEFVGHSKSVSQYYIEAKIFAFTSLSEGFPNSLGEAMVNGLACISFDCITGPSEIIENEKNGLLIEMEDQLRYKNELLRLINSEDLQKKFSNNGFEFMKKYSIENVMLNFKKILNDPTVK